MPFNTEISKLAPTVLPKIFKQFIVGEIFVGKNHILSQRVYIVLKSPCMKFSVLLEREENQYLADNEEFSKNLYDERKLEFPLLELHKAITRPGWKADQRISLSVFFESLHLINT